MAPTNLAVRPTQVSLYEVYTALRLYGAIIGLADEHSFTFELVDTQRTHHLKAMHTFRCAGYDIPVYWRRPYDAAATIDRPLAPPPQPTEQRPKVPQRQSPMHILNALNDDCLLESFKYVTAIKDFCAIAQTCVRFNDVIRRSFRSRCHKYTLVFRSAEMPLRVCEQFLRNFGEFIGAVRVLDTTLVSAYEDIVIGLIAYHCRAIQRLSCRRLQPISLAIRRYFTFHNRSDVPMADVLAAAPFGQLRVLDYTGPRLQTDTVPYLRLPGLTELRLHRQRLVDEAAVGAFFAAHTQLKCLLLEQVVADFHISAILKWLPNLEELTVTQSDWLSNGGDDDDDDIDYGCAGRLTRMRTFSGDGECVLPILRAMCRGGVRLQHLSLQTSHFPACVDSMASIKRLDCAHTNADSWCRVAEYAATNATLRTIYLSVQCETFEPIAGWLRHAPAQLRTLEVRIVRSEVHADYLASNRTTIGDIGDLIQRCAFGVSVRVEVTGSLEEQSDAGKELLQQHSDWLCME